MDEHFNIQNESHWRGLGFPEVLSRSDSSVRRQHAGITAVKTSVATSSFGSEAKQDSPLAGLHSDAAVLSNAADSRHTASSIDDECEVVGARPTGVLMLGAAVEGFMYGVARRREDVGMQMCRPAGAVDGRCWGMIRWRPPNPWKLATGELITCYQHPARTDESSREGI
ncbi:uncharacterized protein MYCFIDRAFT_177683 [Pseudocercospora fijiensis CIRAD86]|uniref:Uncharacterized protein n=1 Tax=Pseudocercospora fijiensis (strain CIRAD86) TaxID=383855 RepID=M2ZIQ7_PSEFD|nr:uncharacterized protein MYCFIDRAFT_177683 [Pseudocercospora fijiensis CIRAD86]EME78999.1 hypothetical protein MYCFIDRAFT_177683 [Pseudocercospora fijiensis CIRAD86]